jgi:hypothetical protein
VLAIIIDAMIAKRFDIFAITVRKYRTTFSNRTE